MSGTPELSRREPNQYCEGESHLSLASSRSFLFSFDLDYVRNKVACDVFDPKKGVEFMHEQEAISRVQKEQLLACLSLIATGGCEVYPLMKN